MSDKLKSTHRPWWGDPHDGDTAYYELYDDDGFALGLSDQTKAEHEMLFAGLGVPLVDRETVRIYKDYTPEISSLIHAEKLPLESIELKTRDPFAMTSEYNIQFDYYFRIRRSERVEGYPFNVYRTSSGTAYAYPTAIARDMTRSQESWQFALNRLLYSLGRRTLEILMTSPEVTEEMKDELDPERVKRREWQR